MQIEHHDIHHEFPEYKELITKLKVSDHHFRKLAEDYAKLTKEIEIQEKNGGLKTDAEMEDLKKKRLHAKDELFHIINAKK